ncbi:interleukin-8-like [Mantella aurantiaca]
MKATMTILAVLSVFLVCITLSEGRTLISAQELRCQCIKKESKQISAKHFLTLEVIPKGPHCRHVEVIATMKSGLQVCLEPTATWVKKIIDKFLNSAKTTSS